LSGKIAVGKNRYMITVSTIPIKRRICDNMNFSRTRSFFDTGKDFKNVDVEYLSSI
jgi:hypothetical protein